jgi:hypothetical protein
VSGPALADVLAQTVFSDGANVPFGELTRDAIRARAQELQSTVGWGPMVRVAGVAMAWRELAAVMERAGAATVAELEPATVLELAPKLWVVPPGGSLL